MSIMYGGYTAEQLDKMITHYEVTQHLHDTQAWKHMAMAAELEVKRRELARIENEITALVNALDRRA
jgi:hypothetical protein